MVYAISVYHYMYLLYACAYKCGASVPYVLNYINHILRGPKPSGEIGL